MKSDTYNSIEPADPQEYFLRRSAHAYCPVCRRGIDLLSFTEAADLFHTDLQDIEFLAKRGELHQVHNRRGKLMICSDSLYNCFDNRKTRLLDSGIFKDIAANWPDEA